MEDSTIFWVPATHPGDLEEAPGYCLWPDLTQAIAVIWRVNQWIEDLTVCLYVCIPHSVTLISKIRK